MPNISQQSPHSSDPLGMREEFGKIENGKNPFRMLFFPLTIGWNAVKPLLGMTREKMSDALGKTIEFGKDAVVGGTNQTRIAISEVLMNAPIIPTPGQT